MSNENSAPTDLAQQAYGPMVGNRWIQLAAGVTAMIVISNFQYAFTLFTPGLKQTFATVPYSDIALIYTLFILFETWPVPVAGYFIDKFGIRSEVNVYLDEGRILVTGDPIQQEIYRLY